MKPRLLLAPLPAAVLLVTFLAGHAHAQWTWLYPKPHGNNLHDVTFLTDNTAIAVGDAGTIMVSHDAGFTWTSSFRTNSLASTLRRLDRIDNVTAVVVGDGGVILKTADGGATWTTIPSSTTASLNDVSFAGLIGIAVDGTQFGPHVMLRSTDGGDSWSPVPDAPYPAGGIEMATASVAYCKMDFLLLKSVDGGLTWAILPNAPTMLGYAHMPLSFADELNGVVSTGSSSVHVTHDGGATWSYSEIGTVFVDGGAVASDLEYRLPETIFASVVEAACDLSGGPCSTWGDFFRSTNAGTSWSYEGAQRPARGVAMSSSGTGLVVGDAGVIHRWTPPGTWQQVGGTTHWNQLTDPGRLAFRSALDGVLLGTSTRGPYTAPISENVIVRTTSAGSDWDFAYWGWPYGSMKDIAYAPGTPDLYGIAAPSDGIASSSALLKSTDAGATWSTVWTDAQDFGLAVLEFSTPTHAVAVGPGGFAAVIDGATVTTAGIPTLIQSVAFADASTAVAVGGGTTRIIRSTDGGSTWAPVTSPLANWFYDVAFSSPSVGVIVGPGDVMLRTTDGGLTWTPIAIPPALHQFLRAVAFSGNYGLAVGGWDGTVLETTNAGQTWATLIPPATGELTDVTVFAPFHALVAGPELTVLEYRSTIVPTLFSSFDVLPHDFTAELRWSVHNEAQLERFRIVRNHAPLTSVGKETRAYRDEAVIPGASYEYVLVAVDRNGDETQSATVRVNIPKAAVELLPNQPNPFNPSTTIRFVVPEKMRVRLTVHDVGGRLVATLVEGQRGPGMHSVQWAAEGMASGVYFARLRAGKADVSRKMVLLK